jgi:pimeloyl-ACP methyl ester carboxylesterase
MPEYLKVDGHDLYCYEWENDGEAVVLLHGGLSKTSSWDYLLVPALEDDFHVFAYDRTAHGFTGDRAGSLHFEFQTKEAIGYLETVVKEPAHLVGSSDGAIIALMVAIARPDLVKSIISIGGNFHHSGVEADMGEPSVSEEDLAEYTLVSPDAPHTLLEKITRMFKIWKHEPDISIKELSEIQCPVLVVSGDDDVITLAHTQELYEALALGQLAVLPGTSHGLVKEKPELFNAIMMQFLEDLSYPITIAPVRRTNPVSNQPE